jgi:putative peptidoglycan lipid II flippase
MVVLALNFGLNLALMHPLKHVGPPLATTIAACLNVGLLSVMLLRRGYLRPDRMLFSKLGRMLAGTCIMALALGITRHALVPRGGLHVSLVALGVLVLVGLASYGGLAQALGLMDARVVLAQVRRRLPGRLRRA